MVPNLSQGAETKLLHVLRPVVIIFVKELTRKGLTLRANITLGIHLAKADQQRIYLRSEEAMHMPGFSIMVQLRYEQIPKFHTVLLCLVFQPILELCVVCTEMLCS